MPLIYGWLYLQGLLHQSQTHIRRQDLISIYSQTLCVSGQSSSPDKREAFPSMLMTV